MPVSASTSLVDLAINTAEAAGSEGSPSSLGFSGLLALLAIGGAIGGMLDVLNKIDLTAEGYESAGVKVARSDVLVLLLRNASVGIGGSLALTAVRIWLDSFESTTTEPLHLLFNLSVSVVAGFAARTLLPTIASKLEKQVAAQGEELSDQKQELETLESQVAEQMAELEYQEQMAQARVALDEGAVDSDRKRAFDALSSILEANPVDRRAAIWLGRIHAEASTPDFDKAIAQLTKFLEEKTSRGQGEDGDAAAAMYNRACYSSLKSEVLGGQGAPPE